MPRRTRKRKALALDGDMRYDPPMNSTRTTAIIALIGVWVVAGAIVFFARSARPSPEAVGEYIRTHQLTPEQSQKERDKILTKAANQLNQLTYEERRELRREHGMDKFFRSLTPEEQARFLDLTLPVGFSQMMDAFNKMPPEKRKKFVEKTLEEMRKHQPEEAPKLDNNAQRIIHQGLRSFYSEASAQTKLDLAPLIEQMQRSMQAR